MPLTPPLPALSATARALLAGAAGFGVAAVAAVLALRQGPAAALALGVACGAALWLLRGRIELASDHWPRRVPLPPPGPILDLPVLDETPDLPPPTLLDLVALPGGRFWMGTDPKNDPQAYQDEQPRHEVTLAPFRIARTPVTRGQWRAVMAEAPVPWRRDNPREWAGPGDDDLPATHVTWFDALAFCNALSLAEGLTPCYAQNGRD